MKLDSSLLPEGTQSRERAGFYAEYYPDGQLAHFGYYVDGAPRGWVLHLEPGWGAGRAERYLLDDYAEEVPLPDDRAEERAAEELFEEWVTRWIGEIALDARAPRRCDFCGKTDSEVRRLIAGARTYICDECVDLCVEVLRDLD